MQKGWGSHGQTDMTDTFCISDMHEMEGVLCARDLGKQFCLLKGSWSSMYQ